MRNGQARPKTKNTEMIRTQRSRAQKKKEKNSEKWTMGNVVQKE